MPIGAIIPWSDFTKETADYHNMLSSPIEEAGVSPTTTVTFTIDNLVSYLNGLKSKGASEVAVNMSVVNVSGTNKLSVIFTAQGATEPSPFGTAAYNNGDPTP